MQTIEEETLEQKNIDLGEGNVLADRQGREIMKFFRLKLNKEGRVNTAWGDKTPTGLYLSLQRFTGEENASCH